MGRSYQTDDILARSKIIENMSLDQLCDALDNLNISDVEWDIDREIADRIYYSGLTSTLMNQHVERGMPLKTAACLWPVELSSSGPSLDHYRNRYGGISGFSVGRETGLVWPVRYP